MNAAHEFNAVSLRDIAGVLFKYKLRIIAVPVAAILAATAYLLYTDSVYEAEIKLLVLLGPEKFSAMESYNRDDTRVVFQERGENIANEMEIIRDKRIAHNVLERFKEALAGAEPPQLSFFQRVKKSVREAINHAKDFIYTPFYKLGLATKLTEDELLLLELKDGLHVEFLEVTDIIRMTFRHKNPELAAFVLNTYAQEYLAQRAEILKRGTSQGFYKDQIKLYSDKLESIETALDELRKSGDISSLNTQRELLLTQISQLGAEYNNLVRELEESRLMKRNLEDAYRQKGHWLETPESGKDVIDLKSMDDKYFALLAKRNELLAEFSERSHQVQDVDFQINQIRDDKAQILRNFLANRIKLREQNLTSISKELAGYRDQLKKLGDIERRLTELQRDRNLIENSYISYKKKSEDLRISENISETQISSVRIISPAVAPSLPASPKKKLILVLAALVGVILGLGYALVARFFDHSFHGAADVERVLGVPLLLTLPDMQDT